MKKGFNSLTAEDLASTVVNATFSNDFKENTDEDWNLNYQPKVVEKLQKCKFHMHWFMSKQSQPGMDDDHENFMKLVAGGDVENVFQYLRKNDISKVLASVEAKSKRSPLHVACKHGHCALVEYFLERGADVDARDRLLKTPLHYACEAGYT